MTEKIFNKTEGDINLTEERARWQETFLSEKSKALLEEDSKYFLHQALSTPCLSLDIIIRICWKRFTGSLTSCLFRREDIQTGRQRRLQRSLRA